MLEWKDVVGYEGLYQVSCLGDIRSFPKKTRRGTRILKPHITQGYKFVHLCKDKSVRKKRIHRAVAEAFIQNPHNLPQVNHINSDRGDNSISNLEWVTSQRNNEHGQAKTWHFKLYGEPVTIYNIRKFCREHNLKHQYFSMLNNGSIKQYAGYSL